MRLGLEKLFLFFFRTEIKHFLQSEKDAFQAGVDFAQDMNLGQQQQTGKSPSSRVISNNNSNKSDSQKMEDAARASSYFQVLEDIGLPPIFGGTDAKIDENLRKEAILFMQVSQRYHLYVNILKAS